LELAVRNVPPRYVASSLQLQLSQLIGLERPGFAYRLRDGVAEIWCWDEQGLEAQLSDGAKPAPGVLCWPEPLLRVPLASGLHLLRCVEGFEAVEQADGALQRTRWFAQSPTADQWAAFVRDAGADPAKHPLPPAASLPWQARQPEAWRLKTSLARPLSKWALLGAAAACLIGSLIIVGSVYQYKLDTALAADRAELARLRQENKRALALQQRIAEQARYIEILAQFQPKSLQLDVLRDLAASGLLGETSKVSLSEWEYRNGRLRMVFQTPPQDFRLSAFLARLEHVPALADIRLLPESAPFTVAVQANVRPTRGAAAAAAPATAAAGK
jgi:hypothetical protein